MINQSDFKTQENEINKVGIIGGTFDPIHNGHLFIAETALDRLKLNKVIFIPNGRSPHKIDDLITDSLHRMAMLNLAVEGNSLFEISSIEIDKEETSYSIDTVKELKKYYDKETELYFIVGADAFIEIQTWKDYKELLEVIKFVVITRGVYNTDLLNEKIRLFQNENNAEITKINIPTLDISSTDIRDRRKKGNSIKYLLPQGVEKYIFENKLYL